MPRRDKLNASDMEAAAAALSKTDRGQNAMRWLLGWLDDDGLGLDGLGQEAALLILEGAWGPLSGTSREAMRQYVFAHEIKRA